MSSKQLLLTYDDTESDLYKRLLQKQSLADSVNLIPLQIEMESYYPVCFWTPSFEPLEPLVEIVRTTSDYVLNNSLTELSTYELNRYYKLVCDEKNSFNSSCTFVLDYKTVFEEALEKIDKEMCSRECSYYNDGSTVVILSEKDTVNGYQLYDCIYPFQ